MKTIIEQQCSAYPKLGVAAGWTTAISMTVAASETNPSYWQVADRRIASDTQ